MRFEELCLLAFGPFTDSTLQLKPGLNVLYGPNEAGKSSVLRAVQNFLFGFGHKKEDDFLHNADRLRVGATLADERGGQLTCVRRRGRAATLRDARDDQKVDEGFLNAMLGGVSPELFETVFGIDHARLREGGQDVVRGKGQIGELLFAAGGVTHLREKQVTLNKRVAELFKPRASNPEINKALSQLKQLSDEVKRLQRSPEQWAEHDKDRQRIAKAIQELTTKLEELEASRARLGRIHSALGYLASWKTKRDALELLEDTVTLSVDAEKRFDDAQHQQIIAESNLRRAKSQIKQLLTELESLSVSRELLDEIVRIDNLYLRLGNHRKDTTDLVGLEAQQRTARDNAKRAIAKLGWEVTLEDAVSLRLPDEKKALVRRLATRHGEVTRAVRDQQETLVRLTGQQSQLEDQMSEAAVSQFPTELKDKLAFSTPVIDVEESLPKKRSEVERLTQDANSQRARLSLGDGQLGDALQLSVPNEETVERFDGTLRTLESNQQAIENQINENSEEAQRVEQDLNRLERAESVPSEQELQELRLLRDQGIRLAVRELTGEAISADDRNEFIKSVNQGESLAAALEPSVRTADAIADRLRRESDRVVQKSQLLAERDSLTQKANKLSEQASQLESERDAWNQEWRSCWAASGISPKSPPEMRSWNRQYERLLSLAADLQSASSSLWTAEDRVGHAKQALGRELKAVGASPLQDARLSDLVANAQQSIKQAEAAVREHERLKSEQIRFTNDVQDAKQKLATAEAEQAEWKSAWAQALQPLRLQLESLPEQAEAVLSNLAELFQALDEREDLRKRIWGIEQTAKEFGEETRILCTGVAPDLVEMGPDEAIAMVCKRLEQAREASQQEESIKKQLKQEESALQEAQNELANGRTTLDALAAEAGVTQHDELPAAIKNSTRKRQLSAEVEELHKQLLPFCAGKTLDAFEAEADGEQADRLPSQIEQLDQQIGKLRTERDEAIRDGEATASFLRQFGGESEAADKAAEREFLLSQLELDAHEYLVSVVASQLLQRAVERYQEKSQGPVLAGASGYFAKLTCGAFSGLCAEIDEDGNQVLVGSRPDGSWLPVQAMSEGSCDQLYLALRLGTLDHRLTEHDPIPFIVDDILLTFDDDRATAALKVFAEVSKKTQVLLFTHHEHLVEIAGSLQGNDGNKIANIISEL